MTEKAFVELGSNIQPERYLPHAVEMLEKLGRIIAKSNVYQNPAIASEPQPDFMNAAVLIETDIPALELRDRLREIEKQLGRVRTADKYAPRIIDLDIALYGSLILEHPLLHIPDKHIYERPHLPVTLAECDPDFIHPQTGERLSAIADRLYDPELLKRRDDLDLRGQADQPREDRVS